MEGSCGTSWYGPRGPRLSEREAVTQRKSVRPQSWAAILFCTSDRASSPTIYYKINDTGAETLPSRRLELREIAGQRERDDLSSAVRQKFEAACPTHVKDVSDFACLPLAHDFSAGRHANARRLKLREMREFMVGKMDKGANLFCQDTLILLVAPHGFGLSGALRHSGAPELIRGPFAGKAVLFNAR